MKIPSIFILTLIVSAATVIAKPIAKGDNLTISVRKIPKQEFAKINNVYAVANNGTINMPFIGSFRAAGRKPGILAFQLAKAYKDAEIYPNPVFTVTIKAPVPEKE